MLTSVSAPPALRQYEECQRLLAEALGVSPDEETQALYAELRGNTRGTLFSMQRPETTVAASSLPPIWEEATSPAVLPSVFVGRTDELVVLSAALESARRGQGTGSFRDRWGGSRQVDARSGICRPSAGGRS